MTAVVQSPEYWRLMGMQQSALGTYHVPWCQRPCDGVCRTTVAVSDGDGRRYQVSAELPRSAVAPTITITEEWSRRALTLDPTVMRQLVGLAGAWSAEASLPEPGLRPHA